MAAGGCSGRILITLFRAWGRCNAIPARMPPTHFAIIMAGRPSLLRGVCTMWFVSRPNIVWPGTA